MRFSHILQERKTAMYFVLNWIHIVSLKVIPSMKYLQQYVFTFLMLYTVFINYVFSLRRRSDCEGLDYQGSSVTAINLSVKR